VAENAERGVIFNLKANVDAQAKTNVDAFFESIIGGQAKVNSAVDSVAVTTQSQVKATIEKMANELGQAQERVVADASAIAQKTAESNRTIQTESAASAEQFASKAKIANASVAESQEKTAKEIVESWTNSYTASSVAAEKAAEESVDTVKESAKSIAERIRELEGEKTQIRKISADAERADYIHAQLALVDITRRRIEAEDALIEAQDREESKRKIRPLNDNVIRLRLDELEVEKEIAKKKKIFLEAEKKEKAALVEQELKGLKSIAAEQEKVASIAASRNEQIGRSVGRVVSAFSEGSEALMRFANGFKYLGLVGETDLKKLTDALLTIQGTTQVFTGAIRLVRQAAEGYDAYRKVVLLTAEAHTALAAAKTVEAAAGSFSGRATAGAVGGAAGSAAGAVAGGAAGSTLGYLATAGAGAGVGVGIGLGAIGIETGGMAGLAVLGTAGAAIAGLAVDLYAFKELIQEWQTFDFGQGAKKGGFVETMGTSSFNPFFQIMRNTTAGDNFVTRGTGLRDDMGDTREAYIQKDALAKRLTEAEKMREAVLKRNAEDEKRIAELNREQTASAQTKAQAERDALSSKLAGMSLEDRRKEIVNQIAETQKKTAITAEERAKLTDEREKSTALLVDQRAKQVIQLANQRLAVEKEITTEQTRAAQETLKTAKEELATKEKQIKVAQDAATSAAERFGLLDVVEQGNLLEMKKQFTGNAQGMDVDQLRKLRGFSGALDEQIASEARRRAQAAGFGAFQTEDLKRIQSLEAERAQIEVKVKAQAQVIAKLEVDSAAVAKEINKQIDAQFGIIIKEMASQIGTQTLKVKELEDAMRNRFNKVAP
jgi:hypothetical protein